MAAAVHLLLYPYPASGHIIPLLDLAHQLLTRGLTITILVTPKNLPLLEPLLSAHPHGSLHSLLISVPESTPPEKPMNRLVSSMRDFQDHHSPILLRWFQSHPSPPVAIVSDFFLGWTLHLASQLNVPRIVFSPSGAFSQLVFNSLWRDLLIVDDPENMDCPLRFSNIPSFPTFPWWQISPPYRTFKQGNPEFNFLRDCILANIASWGVVFNSFRELERTYIDHTMKELGHDRVWAVGPLLPPGNDLAGSTTRGGCGSVATDEVMAWLDARSDNSVVYVCFGSHVMLTRQQMDELAAALELSGVQFIWCSRTPDVSHVGNDFGMIPSGFEDRMADRGFVIKGWAPQVPILQHRAVGSFLTHCGWNSVLEGIAAGVVMLTWAMGADQFTNAKLLVDQLGVGIRVGEGNQSIPHSSELAIVLANSVDITLPERVRVMKLSEVAGNATKEGTSAKDLDEFVTRVKASKELF